MPPAITNWKGAPFVSWMLPNIRFEEDVRWAWQRKKKKPARHRCQADARLPIIDEEGIMPCWGPGLADGLSRPPLNTVSITILPAECGGLQLRLAVLYEWPIISSQSQLGLKAHLRGFTRRNEQLGWQAGHVDTAEQLAAGRCISPLLFMLNSLCVHLRKSERPSTD